MDKSPDAFRTISEVAEWLDIPTHVLRFWESRFSQIKPVKRAGGRRYYRPSDMRLIGGVKVMLHDQGMTIRAVQKTLREEGIKHVSSFSPSLDGEDDADVIDGTAAEVAEPAEAKPAPAARGTHAAAPAAVVEDDNDNVDDDIDLTEPPEDGPDPLLDLGPEPDEEPEEAPVMFRRTSRIVREETPPADELPLGDADAPEAIPLPPGVPETDPSDNDPAFAADTGPAARLIAAPRRRLAPHAAALAEAREKLASIRARMDG
ncbi:MAG: MerR family transcriptional regulator [Pseudomonadota bacterium]